MEILQMSDQFQTAAIVIAMMLIILGIASVADAIREKIQEIRHLRRLAEWERDDE